MRPRSTSPTVHVRDSKNKDGARLIFAGDSWTAFLTCAADSR
ncbi:DUF397 domain-containing protein [Streptomyces sp. KR55]